MLSEEVLGISSSRRKGRFLIETDASRSSRVAIVFDDPEWTFCNLFVDEEVGFALENEGVAPDEIARRVSATLAIVGLPDFGRRRVSTLSGGEMRRLAVANALINDPDIIVTDDLDASLDPAAIADLRQTLAQYVRKRNAVWVDTDRRWHTATMPSEPFASVHEGRLVINATSEQRREAMLRLAPWIGMPFAEDIVALVRRAVPAFNPNPDAIRDPEDLVGLLLTERLRLHSRVIDDQQFPKTTAPLLEMRRVGFRYQGSTEVLNNCDFSLWPGRITALSGRNGSGKSTLARLVVGLRKPGSGSVYLGGRKASPARLMSSSAMVFQNPDYQFVTDSVNTEILRASRGRLNRQGGSVLSDVSGVLEEFSLADQKEVHPSRLSLGEKRRLALAIAASRKSNVLVVDEPTLGQDARQTRVLASALRKLADSGRAVMIITHDADFVAMASDEEYQLEGGRTLRKHAGDGGAEDLAGVADYTAVSYLRTLWRLACANGVASGPVPKTADEILVVAA